MRYVIALLLCMNTAHAADPEQFLTEWLGLIHVGVFQCDYHINVGGALRQGEKIFTDYFERSPTTRERILAMERKERLAVMNYSDGGITCALVARSLSRHLY